MHSVSVQSARDDPPSEWRIGGTGAPTNTDTAHAGEPPLVGRDDLLAGFDRLADRARAGERRVLALSGEAGIGKTRLLREFARRAGEHQLDVSWAAHPAGFCMGRAGRGRASCCAMPRPRARSS